MLIGELAERVSLSTATLRRLEAAGILKSARDRNGWRVYDQSAVEMLRNLYKRPVNNDATILVRDILDKADQHTMNVSNAPLTRRRNETIPE